MKSVLVAIAGVPVFALAIFTTMILSPVAFIAWLVAILFVAVVSRRSC